MIYNCNPLKFAFRNRRKFLFTLSKITITNNLQIPKYGYLTQLHNIFNHLHISTIMRIFIINTLII